MVLGGMLAGLADSWATHEELRLSNDHKIDSCVSKGPLSLPPVQGSQKSSWATGKVVAAVLVVVLIVGVLGFAGFNYLINRPSSPSSSSSTCANGATSYPGCNLCPSGQSFAGDVASAFA